MPVSFCYHFSTGDKLISFTEETFCYHLYMLYTLPGLNFVIIFHKNTIVNKSFNLHSQ